MRNNCKYRGLTKEETLVFGYAYTKNDIQHIINDDEDVVVICQDEFTGFYDKNNKEIYENDIIRIEIDNIGYVVGIVVFRQNKWQIYSQMFGHAEYAYRPLIISHKRNYKVLCRDNTSEAEFLIRNFGLKDNASQKENPISLDDKIII